MASNNTTKEHLKQITDSIEIGIKELLESDKYMQYLRTMSRFHSYSLNNTLLISMQKPDATLVAGFNKWRDQFSRHVKKGERGIKIIVPTPYKIKKEQEKLDPLTKVPMLDKEGKVITEEVEIKVPLYKVVSVFDITQTEGEPLPNLADNLTGNVKQFELFMEALKRSSPVPLFFEKMEADKDGYFSSKEQYIAIREGMSEVQTVSAAIHEIAHSKLHNYEKDKTNEQAESPKPKDRRTEEVEAESISFAVCSYYDIKADANSFGYIASWSKGKDLPELRSSLEIIGKTASTLIDDIDRHFAKLSKEQGIEKVPEYLAYKVGELYFSIQETEGGYDYSIYDSDYNLLDGGVYDDPDISIHEAIDRIVVDDPVSGIMALSDRKNANAVDYDELTEKADTAWNDSIAASKEKELLPESPAQYAYPLPDPTISFADRNTYGYADDEMLPLSQARAAELFEHDLTVYLLYEDNTEAMAFDREDIDNHNGIFGIECNDWTALQDYEMVKNEERFSTEKLEQHFLEQPQDAYAIYQLRDGEALRDYRFEGMERLKSLGLCVAHDNYELIYTAPLSDFSGDKIHALNKLFEQFNLNHPGDFKNHSLSVSDIVALKVNGVVSSHYVDRFNFSEQPNFLPAPNYLETVEKSTEQNYNQIDGMLNNQPTVAELEATVKTGGTISLLDLANSVQAEKKEKRISVVEQLKSLSSTEKEKQKKAPYIGAEMER